EVPAIRVAPLEGLRHGVVHAIEGVRLSRGWGRRFGVPVLLGLDSHDFLHGLLVLLVHVRRGKLGILLLSGTPLPALERGLVPGPGGYCGPVLLVLLAGAVAGIGGAPGGPGLVDPLDGLL